MKRNTKWIAILASVCVLNLAGCKNTTAAKNDNTNTEKKTMEEVINPFVTYETVEEAKKHLSFDVTVPESLDGYNEQEISVMSEKMFQIVYKNETQEICVRKQAGEEDISGDYTKYEEESIVNQNDLNLRFRGDGGLVKNATWTKDGYSYSIYADVGLSSIEMMELALQIQ